MLKRAFGDAGWECPQILAALESAGELYFDQVSQMRLPRWSQGRVALIGDAAACVSLLAGEGTGLGYGGGLRACRRAAACAGRPPRRVRALPRRLHSFLEDKQATAAKFASSFAPKTAVGITLRNWASQLLRVSFLAEWLVRRQLHDDITLPNYGLWRTVGYRCDARKPPLANDW